MLYVGNDGGAYSTSQIKTTSPTFTALNSTLSVTQFYPGLTIDPSNPKNAIGGTQDNGTELYSGAAAWNQVTCGDGAYTAIDAVTPSTMYAACENIYIQKSTASGSFSSWNLAESGINTADRVDFIPPLVMDPSASATLYFGTYRVYQTTNGASSWAAISPDLTNGSGFWAVLTAIAVAPTDSNTLYAGTGDSHVQVTTNASAGASATWSNRSTNLPPRVITCVAADPTVSTTAYVTFSGFTGFGDTLGHVFKTTNGGSTWTDISSDLPNTPVNSLVIVPDIPNSIFVGTDIGVFYTSNGGTSWSSLVDGLPNVAVLGLAIHNASRTLRASTHGRGVWDINFSTLLSLLSITSLSPVNATAGGAGFTLTVGGEEFDSTSTVQWNGASLATTFVNSGQVTATVPASDIAAAGVFQVTVFNSSSGDTSNQLGFTVNNPVPSITSVSPTSATAGGGTFTLTVKGSNFVAGSVVQWNGSNRATTYVSGVEVTAAITATDIAHAGTAQVTVVNPAPGGGTSGAATFNINNPVPVLTSLTPSFKTAGGVAFTLTVKGTGFVSGAAVQWNGSTRTTTYKSSILVTASILASDIATAATVPITVVNPAPGGGGSNTLTFTVKNTVPHETSLTPSSATEGGAPFAITVNGSNFISASTLEWNGSVRTTTFVSKTQLKAAITSADIAKSGTAKVTVANPAPGGGTSAALTFTVNNPTLGLTSLSPSSATAGAPTFTLTVNGSNFVSTSAIHWNSLKLTTKFVNASQLTATVPGSEIAKSGTAEVTVVNPTPGGGMSNKLTFTINP